MTQEQAKEFLPLIQAFADGKVIQYKPNPDIDEWVDIENPGFCYNMEDYRIKIEPQFRPFKNAQECWEEMKRHEPFGWFKLPNGCLYSILHLTEGGVVLDDMFYCYSSAFKEFVFTDGTPFGAKKED